MGAALFVAVLVTVVAADALVVEVVIVIIRTHGA
jgi:hypothetical protein